MVYRYGDGACPGDFVELGSSNEEAISSVLYGGSCHGEVFSSILYDTEQKGVKLLSLI